MPALITHYLCGNKMLEYIEDGAAKNLIQNHRNIFNLGTQGPDILFYYGAWPWTGSKGIPEIGHRMHEEKTGEFMCEAFKYAADAAEAPKSILAAYLCGYVCHYVLDCHTHPYIFYKTGFVREGESYTPKYTCYHRRFESALDVLMLERELGSKPPEFNAPEQIRVSPQAGAVIGEMYSSVFAAVYAGSLEAKAVSKAITDMAGISSALRDRTGIKKFFMERAEKLLGKAPMFSSMILPKKMDGGRDYLNLLHEAWSLPWSRTSLRTDAFPEMFEAAAREAAVLCTEILSYVYGGSDIERLMGLVGSRSFLTGIDCKLDAAFVSFDCIYEKDKNGAASD